MLACTKQSGACSQALPAAGSINDTELNHTSFELSDFRGQLLWNMIEELKIRFSNTSLHYSVADSLFNRVIEYLAK
ncbi:hypothetical protein CEXT_582411 [Caerostris extrusa]|uniref:Uncharacterized protein n=1 Tax=Caerostris extrusa TaxID=172846 RepID=A0AAV4QKC9_CAEEX|nr:hypothetical protein CEXT_582411 [Caerostris extrusa]